MADPVELTASPDSSGLVWTTSPPYFPPSYSGDSYTHPFLVVPSSGNVFPPSQTAPTPTVTASDNSNGPDNGSGNVTSFNPNQVRLNVTVSNSNILGSGLNLTIVLDYGDNSPK
jgi:hypothetical protein